MIYFDNSATTYPKPEIVRKSVYNSMKIYGANIGRGGYDMSIKTAEKVFEVREKIAKFYDCDVENVAFTPNCTTAINYILKGSLKEGDHIIISSLEHNAVTRPVKALEKQGVFATVAQVDFYDDEITLNNFRDAIRENTKMIFVTAASNVTGLRLPINKLGNLCKKKGILFGVDGAQDGGFGHLSVKKDNIDFLALAPHKGLFAPLGTGVMIARKNLKTIIEGGTGTDSVNLEQPDVFPEKFESGTQNTSGIIAIGNGIDFINSKGKDKLYNHEFSLLKYAYDRLSKINGVIIYGDEPKFGRNVPVLSFNIKDVPSEVVADFLNKNNIAVRAGLHCAPFAHRATKTLPDGTVRISFSPNNYKKEIDYFCDRINRYIYSLQQVV
jgi:cysteine desulfurase family protein